jgi:hypothetical protein
MPLSWEPRQKWDPSHGQRLLMNEGRMGEGRSDSVWQTGQWRPLQSPREGSKSVAGGHRGMGWGKSEPTIPPKP